MSAQHLLPSNATPAEKALSEALDRDAVLGPGADAIAGWRFQRPLPDGFGPYLVDELQLGTIRSFFDSDEATIDAGVPWQRLRGTLAAVEMALGWIDYDSADVEAPNTTRRKWHRYQLAMGDLPLTPEGVPAEDPRLVHADYLASLSDPARSIFVRGYHGYDVRPVQWSRRIWGKAIWGASSGAMIPGSAAKWSHGREHGPFEVTASETTLAALGLDSLVTGTLDWNSTLTWAQVGHLGWGDPTDEQIAQLITNVVATLSKHIAFFDAGGDLIGARRASHITPAETFDGAAVPSDQTVLEVRARTGFGDGASEEATTAALILGAHSTRGPGDLWVTPDNLAAPDGVSLADLTIGAIALNTAPDQGPTALPLTFTRTIREHITIKVRLL